MTRVLYVSATSGVHDRRMITAWAEGGVEVTSLVLDGSSRSSDLVAEAVSQFSPDVVQAGPVPDIAFAVAQSWQGPLIATSWGFDLLADIDADDAARERAASTLTRAEVVMVDSDAVRDRARALGASEEAVVQFPWGIDHELFRQEGADMREALGLDNGVTCILSVRRHESLYDVATLVRAFALAAPVSHDTVLLIGGEGRLTPMLRELVDEAGLADRVRFLAELRGEQLAALYRTADVYVSTSTVDGSSISLLEAMASGAVPLVTDIAGNRQWVPSDVGLRFPVGDHEALARALVELAADASRRRRLAHTAQQLVRERADWNDGPKKLRGAADLAITRHDAKGAS
ncbi:hypothetical protein CQ040_07700 [Microbacterium sp. MYb54]|nr:hypothetical protein CQ032_05890 [Microbacterium sp. MYb43]PQZ81193.1 hypothetical protein CQ031_05500 [Microbacterium sp. MYb40]PRB21802.1 hypothetical protein CQ040_07700 [Microbacterium sp. MYb54]PRB31561.1 hypothetical protein CQ037_02520 [Microbacterium sp. MYb50]PRB68439.1 hypothetical protein CQ021_06705 [Microbacterium sp. MYb24]PRB75561.1 hypothetical protein CQ027_08190 [Microbacterium sp. MYb32]